MPTEFEQSLLKMAEQLESHAAYLRRGEVKICPASNQCLRYLERETFRGRVYQYPIMTAPAIKDCGCSSLITRED